MLDRRGSVYIFNDSLKYTKIQQITTTLVKIIQGPIDPTPHPTRSISIIQIKLCLQATKVLKLGVITDSYHSKFGYEAYAFDVSQLYTFFEQ